MSDTTRTSRPSATETAAAELDAALLRVAELARDTFDESALRGGSFGGGLLLDVNAADWRDFRAAVKAWSEASHAFLRAASRERAA